MKAIFFILLLLIFTFSKPASLAVNKSYTYLALGDSYTIGEAVPAPENFPNQTVALLRKEGFDFHPAEIVAKTGWTTGELQAAIHKHIFHPSYDLVTLLIGVNNQYRGNNIENYKPEFDSLLKQAIQFAGKRNYHVIVLSIPDWSVTPFAADRNKNLIAKEIDEYNAANKIICDKYNVHYINITPGTREALNDLSLLTNDGLHPSGKEYARWAEKVASVIKKDL